MKFAFASSFLFASAVAASNPFAVKSKNSAKASFDAKLMSKARRLNDAEEEDYQVDISGYSLKFEKCQFIKSYSDDMAEDEDSNTVLATSRFVVFKLCSSCGTCNYNYGEYMIDLDDYLQAAVEYQQELQEAKCEACDEQCQADDEEEEQDDEDDQNEDNEDDEQDEDDQDNEDGRRKLYDVDCDSCVDECELLNDLEGAGYYDAANFIQCQMIYDAEDDANNALYAGPMCSNNGEKIKIGVFEDEDCYKSSYGKSVEDYIVDGDGYAMKLWSGTLKPTYYDTCFSCLVEQEQNDDDQAEQEEEQEAQVTDMCQNLYDEAAKCEGPNGFQNGYADNQNYANQYNQEDLVCSFIDSVKGGTYDDEGEISLYGTNSNTKGSTETTGGQKFALIFFILGTVCLAVYAAVLHSKLTKGGKSNLSSQGGAMA